MRMVCLFCKEEFVAKYSWQKYCKIKCGRDRGVARRREWRRKNKEEYAKSRAGDYGRWTKEQQQASLERARVYGQTMRGKLTRLNLHVKHRGQSNLKIDYDDFINKFGSQEWFCNKCSTREDLTFDHVVPFVHGGGHKIENLQILCRSCNAIKGCYERYTKLQIRNS